MASSFTVDLVPALAALDGMAEAGKKLKPAFQKMRGPLRDDQKEHAAAEAGPEGKWPSLAPSTLAKRAARGRRRHLGKKRGRGGIYRKSRKMLGRLPPAFRVKVFDSAIVATWKAPWSGSHQEGDGHVPRRQFGWISDRIIEAGAKIVQVYVIDAFARRAAQYARR